MTLDERTQEIYAALDHATLLALLQTLRSERERHMNLMVEVAKAYQTTVGDDLTAPGTMREFFDHFHDAVGADEEMRDALELVMSSVAASEEEAAALLDDPQVWLEFSSGYGVDLGDREQWVRAELARRGLLPREPGGTVGAG